MVEAYAPAGNVFLKPESAPQQKDNVSSTDLRHCVAAPTFPPVWCRMEYNLDAADTTVWGSDCGAEPLRYSIAKFVSEVCDARYSEGYSGTRWQRVSKMRTCATR